MRTHDPAVRAEFEHGSQASEVCAIADVPFAGYCVRYRSHTIGGVVTTSRASRNWDRAQFGNGLLRSAPVGHKFSNNRASIGLKLDAVHHSYIPSTRFLDR